MKKRILLLSLISLACSVHGQTVVVDTADYRFVYDAQLKTAEDSKKLDTDEHWLEISKSRVSKYSSHWNDRAMSILDSIKQVGGDFMESTRIMRAEGVKNIHFGYSVYKNFPTPGYQTVNYLSLECVQYKEEMGQDWTLLDGDTLTLGYPCQKAVCNYHGRTWTAWYAPDIPLQDGPWKLCGLPGLIMRAYDDKGEFIFNCVGIEKSVNNAMTMRKKVTTIAQATKAHKTIEFMENDKDGYMQMKYGSVPKTIMYDKNGKASVPAPIKWVMMEHYEE